MVEGKAPITRPGLTEIQDGVIEFLWYILAAFTIGLLCGSTLVGFIWWVV